MAGLLAMRPGHLVLDEPTAQLDPAGTRLVADAIARLAGDGASILVAEQKTDLLAAVCSRVVVLDDGRVALWGPARDVLGDPACGDAGRRGAVARAAARARRGRRAFPSHACRRRWPMAELRVEGLVHVYREGGVRALDGVDLAHRAPANGWRSSARTAAARRRSCGTSTACCGRPRGGCWSMEPMRPR